jgi:ribosomal protein S18 acetylase RimI-like enzyme
MFLRPAVLTDAAAIAAVHVRAWRETYRGIMPDSVLEALSVEDRAQRWSGTIAQLSAKRQVLSVAIDDSDTIVGFAGAGPAREAALTTSGEVYAINLVMQATRKGLGARLMIAMADGLVANGFSDAGLWVLEQNIGARWFYERLGGTPAARHEQDFDGKKLTELGYVWRDVRDMKRGAEAALAS